jgi:hypothetical protein
MTEDVAHTLTVDRLYSAVADKAAAVRIITRLGPAGGEGDKLFPPTYKHPDKDSSTYAIETRRIDGREVKAVLLDSAASQANRMEEALLRAFERNECDNLFRHCDRWTVGDFGLVDYPDKESLTDTGERLGPYHYLAPEMLTEANRADGRRADVFSLGKTLWVLATGQRVPPPGELRADNNQMNIQAYQAAPRVHQLDSLIERATRHDAATRPTMSEFAAELRAWLTAPQEPSQPDLSDVFARLQALAPPRPALGDG